jgi:hypothetical protein
MQQIVNPSQEGETPSQTPTNISGIIKEGKN